MATREMTAEEAKQELEIAHTALIGTVEELQGHGLHSATIVEALIRIGCGGVAICVRALSEARPRTSAPGQLLLGLRSAFDPRIIIPIQVCDRANKGRLPEAQWRIE